MDIVKLIQEIIALIREIRAKALAEERKAKTHEDVKAIREAFQTKDPSKLNYLFSGVCQCPTGQCTCGATTTPV